MERRGGFTLVELVVVIAILSIVAVATALFIRQPVQGYIDTSRRAQLVDAAEAALQRMARDIRRALPNSVRTDASGSVQALELINALEALRYRDDPPPGGADKRLEFNRPPSNPETDFNMLGLFADVSSLTDRRLVVYHTGDPGANAYANDPVITPAGATLNLSVDPSPGPNDDEHHINIPAGHNFPHRSPQQRLFVVDTPIAYLCDTANETIHRYWDYPIQASQPTSDGGLTGAGAQRALVVEHLASCSFTYQPGTSERAGLVTLRIELSDEGESVWLLRQIHIPNAP